MKKTYALEELIDVLQQTKAHIERGESMASSVAARQAELDRLAGALTEAQHAYVAQQAARQAQERAINEERESRLRAIEDEAARRQSEAEASHQAALHLQHQQMREAHSELQALQSRVRDLRQLRETEESTLQSIQAVLAKARGDAHALGQLLGT